MRRILLLLALVSLVAGCLLIYRHAHGSAPAICIEVQEDGGWSGGASFLPAVDGYSPNAPGHMSALDDTSVRYRLSESYKVSSSAPGHFFILAHYVINREGQRKEIDRAIPVKGRNDVTAGWTKLDDHLTACAYQAAGTISY
jgi:hypothetical protein